MTSHIHLDKVSARDLADLKAYAEGRLRGAVQHMREGFGNPITDIMDALRILEMHARFVPMQHEQGQLQLGVGVAHTSRPADTATAPISGGHKVKVGS